MVWPMPMLPPATLYPCPVIEIAPPSSGQSGSLPGTYRGLLTIIISRIQNQGGNTLRALDWSTTPLYTNDPPAIRGPIIRKPKVEQKLKKLDSHIEAIRNHSSVHNDEFNNYSTFDIKIMQALLSCYFNTS